MKILSEYTFDYVRRNKKSSLAIMIAILISTAMLSALSGFLYTLYTDNIRLAILETGNWHAELFDDTPGSKLKYVTGNPNVQAVLIKGKWEAAEIDDPRRPYLVMRDVDSKYWNDMPEHEAVMEGRIPASGNELALSKQYFEHHPDLKIGDTISISVGNRTLNGETLEPRTILQKGEVFVPTEKRSYTVVGKLDMTTNSVTPAYLAYGYLDDSSILPDDLITVYIRFNNPRTAYEDIDEIARSAGFEPDGNGDYPVRVNSDLLAKYLIFPPEQLKGLDISQFSMPIMFLVLGLLVMALFVLIINNAFAMSANSRLRQLGMLQSIGASPKQIRRSVIFESLILAVIPVPAGVFTGWLVDHVLIAIINSMEKMREAGDIIFTFGLPAIIPSAFMGLLTVWLSAAIPAKRLTRLSPVEAIRQGGELKVRKVKKHRIAARIFGIEGELAGNALYARRKSYRSAVISLTLSFLVLSIFLNMTALFQTADAVLGDADYVSERDLRLYIQDGNLMDQEAQEQIRSIKGVKSVLFTCDISASLWLAEDMQSSELSATGGLSRIAKSGRYPVYAENGQFRIITNLIALDDESFSAYCGKLGIDAGQFYDTDKPKVIVVNDAKDDINSTRRKEIHIPFLKLSTGDTLNCNEKVNSEDDGHYEFQTVVGFVTDSYPPLGGRYNSFQLAQVMPLSVYTDIIGNFEERRAMNALYVSAPIVVQSDELIGRAADKLEEVCDSWYGSGDYTVWSIIEDQKTEESAQTLFRIVFLSISCLLAVIGISNVISTVSGNLRQRQKEFAVLRSVGLPPKGIRRMLIMEAVFFGLIPIIISIPPNIAITAVLLKIDTIYVSEFIPYLPILPVTAFGVLILLSIMAAYIIGGRIISRDTIMDVLKDEAV